MKKPSPKTVYSARSILRKKETFRKNKTVIQIITLVIFAVLILTADILLIADHGKTFSDTENRMLQTAPPLTGAELVSGKFMSRFEDFTEDQIFARNFWINYKLSADKLIGKRDSNGVFLGKQGYLIEDIKHPIEKNFNRNLDAIYDFASSREENVVMAMIPNEAYICPELLPPGAPVMDQGIILKAMQEKLDGVLDFVKVRNALSAHRNEKIYFKSDHHWTSLGARYAFEEIAPHIGIESPSANYRILPVSDSFTGTMASSSGDFSISDTIEIYIPENCPQYVVEYVGEDRPRTSSIYVPEALETNNQYEVFLGGNFPLITINTTAKAGRRLLLLKDSYANAFVQFLLPYYDMIQIVDPRYYSDDLANLIKMNDITDILFLYNVNTFVEDSYLSIVLAG